MTKAHRRAVREAIRGLCEPGETLGRVWLEKYPDNDRWYVASTSRDGHAHARVVARDPLRALFLLLWHMVGDRRGDPGRTNVPDLKDLSPTASKLDSYMRAGWNRRRPAWKYVMARPPTFCRFPSAKRLRRDVRQIQADLAAYALKSTS